MEKKDSFIVYNEYYDMIQEISTADKGLLFAALFEYQINGVVIELPTAARIIFKFIKKRMDYNDERYQETCQKRKEAGALGGRPKKDENQDKAKKANGFSQKQMQPNVFLENQDKAKKADMDTDTDMDMDIKKETDKEKKAKELIQGLGKTLRIGDSSVVEIKINESFKFSLDDPDVKPYVDAYGEGIVRDVEGWLIRNKCGKTVDLPFICRQFNKFAERQGISAFKGG